MNILGIQIVGVAFGIIFIYLTFMNSKRSELDTKETVFWMVIWGGLVLISFFPNMLNFLVEKIVNVSRTLDFIIIMAFLIMFGIIFYIFILTKRTENRLEKLVRNLALKESKKK